MHFIGVDNYEFITYNLFLTNFLSSLLLLSCSVDLLYAILFMHVKYFITVFNAYKIIFVNIFFLNY